MGMLLRRHFVEKPTEEVKTDEVHENTETVNAEVKAEEKPKAKKGRQKK